MTFHTAMQESSLDAYDELGRSLKLGRQEKLIYDLIKNHGSECDWSLQELSRATGVAINAVSGRVNSLKGKTCLEERERRGCNVTGSSIVPVGLPKRPPIQPELFPEIARVV